MSTLARSWRSTACSSSSACVGRECGPDGCDGSCGECGEHHTCDERGQCIYVPWCGDGTCHPEAGEGCVECPADCACGCGEECTEGAGPGGVSACVFIACTGVGGFPLECGDDGCGGSCGDCAVGMSCDAGICRCPVERVASLTRQGFDARRLGNHLLVAGVGGLRIYDVSAPPAMELVGQWSTQELASMDLS